MDNDDEIEHVYLEEEEASPAPAVQSQGASAVDNAEERSKLKKIIIGITIIAAILTLIRGIELQRFVADFTAVFLVTFAALKVADLENFALTYRYYDFLAKHVRPWGYILPLILAFLGFWYLLSDAPTRLNVTTMIITGITGLSAIKAYRHHYKKQYAYHKTLLRLPFTRINMTENLTIFTMATISLFV